MKLCCPNKSCQNSTNLIKDGQFYRAGDSKSVQRYKCRECGKRFSRSTFTDTYRLKRRRETKLIKGLLSSKMSMRRMAVILNISRSTIASRMDLLAKRARKQQEALLKDLEKSKVLKLQFDDLITIEHTKMKPLSVSIAVDAERRIILGAEVSRIPASGHLAKKSREKYGPRVNNHEKGLTRLFEKIAKSVDENALVKSDMHKTYPKFVAKYLPSCEYKTYEGGRSCVAGQGELKRKGYDPLFTLNHTCAMFRDSINRLVRKTWCSTKKVESLQKHIDIFIAFYNFDLLGFRINTI